MRALVTGGAGFIGSHLAERLVADGHEVTALDDLATGRLANVEHLEPDARFRFVQGDVCDLELVESLAAEADWFFHLAALADVVPSIEHPDAYHRVNTDGTFTAVEAARRAGVEAFVYAASSSCYGIPDRYPTLETAPLRPEYPYALTKALGEQYALHWARVYGLPVVSLRLFNVYGPRSRTAGAYGAVFGVFLAQKLAGEPLTVVGDGAQTRDFVHVTDVADAFVRAAASGQTGLVANIGTGRPQSVNRLVELLGGQVVHLPKRPGEPDSTHADISLAAAAIGWEPRVSFEEGVAAMLERIDDWSDAPVWTPEAIGGATKAWFEHLGREEEEEAWR